MNKTNKQNFKKSIAKVGYAPITENEDGTSSYGAVKWFESKVSGGREYTAEPAGETTEVYADGIAVYSAEENNGYDIKLILLAAIDDVEVDWLGNEKVSGGGIAEIARPIARPKFALIFVEDTTNEAGTTTIYFCCSVSKRPSMSGKTSEGKFELQFPEYQISARPRPEDKWVRVSLPQKELFKELPKIELSKESIPETTEPEATGTESAE